VLLACLEQIHYPPRTPNGIMRSLVMKGYLREIPGTGYATTPEGHSRLVWHLSKRSQNGSEGARPYYPVHSAWRKS
jgi:hypothetical protein